ncbi:4Fe-4S binding protein [Anaerofilum sp. BX8]|uniref:4Fe-4S binding protein n=1 Tax=Anaerofilum hominis TaxID=2763016 RepID=A0A923I8L2_9FIRM|nr:4Fe-4S dicluster domain-containing protein [Anaerofilum hominis]MBC5580258.1 4Fe-4S binding protein [Anaerofilum hominis]
MKRRIIKIDEEKCTGCGLCAAACHEGAIGMEGGKARLLREEHCDGLGDCLPACPAGAISFEEREAPAYDHKGAAAAKTARTSAPPPCGCPGSRSETLRREPVSSSVRADAGSELTQWPVQIRLAPTAAPFFSGADLLVAADCTAYAYGAFHQHLIRGRVVLIGCPKLDAADYAEKLAEIFARNDVRSVTVARMEVPCCGGLENAVRRAVEASGKALPCRVVVISTDGRIVSG